MFLITLIDATVYKLYTSISEIMQLIYESTTLPVIAFRYS